MNLLINHNISFLGVLLFAAGQGTAICEVISTKTSCPATNNLPDYPLGNVYLSNGGVLDGVVIMCGGYTSAYQAWAVDDYFSEFLADSDMAEWPTFLPPYLENYLNYKNVIGFKLNRRLCSTV